MAYNTNNPVGSTDPRDLYDNAENLDKLVNGADPFYADRLGKLRESWAGMENSFTNAQEGRETAFTLSQADKESRFQAFLVSSGYVSKGDYAAGVVMAERNEYVAVSAATTGTSPGLYRPNASATLPLTLTGTWATDSANLVLLGDAVLRQELADPNSSVLVGGIEAKNLALKFNTVADMLSDPSLKDGDSALTYRYNTDIECVWDIIAVAPLNRFWLQAGNGLYAALKEIDYDVRRFGGVDDFDGTSGTNNKVAIDYLIGRKPITIKLPKTNTGVYFYDGALSDPSTDLTGVTLDIDDGVSIHSTGLSNGPFWRKGVKVNRELKSKVDGATYNLYSSPTQYKRPSEQFAKLTAADGFVDIPKRIDWTTYNPRCYQLSAWPSGVLNLISPASTSAEDINLGAIPLDTFKMVGVPVSTGDFITANVKDGTPRVCVFVQTDMGHVLVQQNPTANTFQVVYSNGTSFDYTDDIFAQPEYRFNKASLGIIIYDPVSFGVSVNGVVVKRIDTSPVGSIQMAGWGAGFEAGPYGDVEVNRPSVIYRKRTIGIKPLKIVCVGDSTSAETLPPSQMQYLRQYLSGACGAQVVDIKNLAVGGETSTQQLARLQAANIANYDYCVIQIGVNDVQTSVSSLTLLANINAMIDICLAANVTPIVGLPIQWYTPETSVPFGQQGQNSSNSAAAPRYRSVILHGLAQRSGFLLNSSVVEDQGAVLASLLANPSVDPVVQDNIHPTAYGQMAMGMSYAKAIIAHMTGYLHHRNTEMPAHWFNLGIASSTRPVYDDKDGAFSVSYFFSRNGVSIPDGTVIASLPLRFRPLKTTVVPVYNFTSNPTVPTANPFGFIQFGDDGTVRAYNIDATAELIAVSADWITVAR